METSRLKQAFIQCLPCGFLSAWHSSNIYRVTCNDEKNIAFQFPYVVFSGRISLPHRFRLCSETLSQALRYSAVAIFHFKAETCH